MSELSNWASATHEGLTVSSNTATAEELQAELNPPAEVPPPEPEPAPAPEPGPVAAAPEAEPEKPKKGKPRHDPQARVEEATAKEAAAKRERDDAKAEAARLRAELETARRAVPAPAPAAPTSAVETFPEFAAWSASHPDQPYEAYLDARADWKFDQRERALTAAREQTEAQQAEQRMLALWQQRIAKVKETTPDWDTRFKPETPLDRRVFPYLTAQDDGALILLYLSDHPDLAQRLATLHPIDQIGEFGKISARLEAASPRGPVAQVVPSRATPPIKPLSGGTEPVAEDIPDDEPLEAHIRRYNALDKKAGRR